MKKKFISIMLVLCLSIGVVATAYADGTVYTPYGVRYKNIAVKSYSSSYNDTWVSIIDKSRAAWNNSAAGTTITTSSSANNQVLAAQYDDEWYGLFSRDTISQVYVTKFTIRANARTISDAASNFNNFARSTVVHEFGHAYFLEDEPPTTRASIMSYS